MLKSSSRPQDPYCHTCRKCCSEFAAAGQIVVSDDLGGLDCLRCLGMGAHDQRLGDWPQPPTGCNARDLTRRAMAVAAGTNECRIGSTVDAPQRRIIGPVEEVLHEPC